MTMEDDEPIATLTREIHASVLAPSNQTWPKRPSWLKGAVERELGRPVLDAYITPTSIRVQLVDKLEWIEINVTLG